MEWIGFGRVKSSQRDIQRELLDHQIQFILSLAPLAAQFGHFFPQSIKPCFLIRKLLRVPLCQRPFLSASLQRLHILEQPLLDTADVGIVAPEAGGEILRGI